MTLCTLFINRFIRSIFPSDQKAVPWHSHQVAILDSPKNSKSSNSTTAFVNTPIDDTPEADIEVGKTQTPSRMKLNALTQFHTECCVIVTTPASGIHTVEPEIAEEALQLTFATHG